MYRMHEVLLSWVIYEFNFYYTWIHAELNRGISLSLVTSGALCNFALSRWMLHSSRSSNTVGNLDWYCRRSHRLFSLAWCKKTPITMSWNKWLPYSRCPLRETGWKFWGVVSFRMTCWRMLTKKTRSVGLSAWGWSGWQWCCFLSQIFACFGLRMSASLPSLRWLWIRYINRWIISSAQNRNLRNRVYCM